MISKRVLFVALALLAVSATSAMAATVNVNDFTVGTLSIGATDVLDVANYGIVTVTPYATVKGYIAGGQLISTAAATDPSGLKTLALIPGQDFIDYLGGPFHGHTVLGTDTLVQNAFYGDANLDGFVDFTDYGYIDAGFGSTSGWILGDFNQDGFVDFTDYGYIDAAFGQPMAGAAVAAPQAVGVVPEPSTLVLLIGSALAGLVAFLRKR